MKDNKILKILLPVVILLIIVAVIGKKKGWFGKEATVKVAIEKVAVNPIIESVTANGKIQPETEVKISPDVSGEIVELHVKEGDFVQKGVLLFRIKPEIYMSSRDRAAATLNSTKSRLAQVEAQLIQAELAYTEARNCSRKTPSPSRTLNRLSHSTRWQRRRRRALSILSKAPRHHSRRQMRIWSKRLSMRL
jgi:HlyD family secretion protein